MKLRSLLLLVPVACASLLSQTTDTARAGAVPRDTLFYIKGVTISPITTAGRNSPVTWSELDAL